jgi:hypothetical protein
MKGHSLNEYQERFYISAYTELFGVYYIYLLDYHESRAAGGAGGIPARTPRCGSAKKRIKKETS